jgi:iron-sulfur cluster assembly protein
MLQLSEAAVAEIQKSAGDGGLRFVALESDGEVELDLSVVEGPEPGDEVVESRGVRVFLEPRAAQELDDQILDVHSHGDHVHFVFSPQAS